MALNKFLPNRALVWKEWRSSRAFIGIFLGYVTFVSSIKFINEILDYLNLLRQGVFNETQGVTYLMHQTGDMLSFREPGYAFGAILFTIALAAIMMGLERDQNTFNLLLSMPFSRREIIYNKFIVGLGQLLAVFGLNALIMTVIVWANPDIPFTFGAAEIWAWAWRNMLVLSFVFTFTMLISSLSGTTLGNMLLALIFLFFPFGIFALIAINAQYWIKFITPRFWYGVDQALMKAGMLLTVPGYIMDDTINQYNLWLIYGLLIILAGGFYLLTQHLFARNPLENNGEVLMFEQLEGFFKTGVAVCFALLGGPLLMHLLDISHQAIAIVSYFCVGGTFWILVNKLIKWRKAAI